MKIKQKFFFLALQKYISLEELLIYLDLDLEDVHITSKEFGRRYCSGQTGFFEKIFTNRFVLPAEMIKWVVDREKEVNIKELTNVFNISESHVANLLYHLAKKNSSLAYILASSDILNSEIREIIDKSTYNRLVGPKVKLFRNNKSNTTKLLSMAQDTSIEKISLVFSCSPHVVEEELIYLEVGGFWENENIRTNYPFFVNEGRSKFSKSEILYVINNKNIEVSCLSSRLNTTQSNLEKLLELIEHSEIEEKYLIKLIASTEEYLFKNWAQLHYILNFKKENQNYLYHFGWDTFFEGVELASLKKKLTYLDKAIDNVENTISKSDHDNYIFITKGKNFFGEMLYFADNTFAVKEGAEVRLINGEDIILYKKISF